MATVDFFTPVSFGDTPKSCSQSLLETVDRYFYLGGKKAYVIPGEAKQEAVLLEETQPLWLTACKIVSYILLALPMLLLKVVLRCTHTFHVVDVKQQLAEGIEVSQETRETLERLLPKLEARENDPAITWYKSGAVYRVFSLATAPDLIFKMARSTYSPEQTTTQRLANMVKGKAVCLAYQLDQLVVPQATTFQQGGKTFLVETKIGIPSHTSQQERLYLELPGLEAATQQLATFIAKTGWSDVELRNMLIVDDQHDFVGTRRIALIDLEDMQDAQQGIFGGLCNGLIRCVSSETQIDRVLAEAARHGIGSDKAEQLKARRLEEIEDDRQLQRVYEQNGIFTNPRKPLCVDVTTLGLKLEEEGYLSIREIRKNGSTGESEVEWRQQPITLREAAEDVVAQINAAIEKAPAGATPQAIRSICLDANMGQGSLDDYYSTGLKGRRIATCSYIEEVQNETWLWRIIDALVKHGYLCKLNGIANSRFYIQA